MPTDSINADILFAFIGALSFLLLIDRYLGRRRHWASNAAYLERHRADRINLRLHRMGRPSRVSRLGDDIGLAGQTWESQIESSAPGFFSRRRIISDRLGRLVASHYEELVIAGFAQKVSALSSGERTT
jgi:hypothetical protein